MASFDNSVKEMIIEHEGVKFTNRPNDRGGPTKFGITLRFFKECLGDHKTVEDLKNLTQEQALDIYEKFIWNDYRFSRFLDQKVANKVFDMVVNMGDVQAVKILQRACNDFGAWLPLVVDGILGSKTVGFANNVNSAALLLQIKKRCVRFYLDIIDRDPKQIENKKGWLRRAES
jgi:lysozyme family protein